jgi:hypothetical protein
MLTQPLTYIKAIYGAAIAGLGAVGTVLVGDTHISDLTQGQWVTVAITMLVAGGGVFGLTNKPG